MCINRFYCSTDNEANYEKILYGLGDRFDLYDLDGRDNWMRGEFVSCEPVMQYLEAHIYDNGMWNSF